MLKARRIVHVQELFNVQLFALGVVQYMIQHLLGGHQSLRRVQSLALIDVTHGHTVHQRYVGRIAAGVGGLMAVPILIALGIIDQVHIHAGLQAQIRKDLLSMHQKLIEPGVKELVHQAQGRLIFLRHIHLIIIGEFFSVERLDLLQRVVFPDVISETTCLGKSDALFLSSLFGHVENKMPEILPGNESTVEIAMGIGSLIDGLHIIIPGFQQIFISRKIPITVAHIGTVLVIVPGVTHSQADPQAGLLGCCHDPIQLLQRKIVVADGIHLRLKLSPGNGYDDTVKAVLFDLLKICLQIIQLTVPEIHDPFVTKVGGGFEILRFLSKILCLSAACHGKHQNAQQQKCQHRIENT